MNVLDMFDMGDFLQIFIISQSTEILVESNFRLGMYVLYIRKWRWKLLQRLTCREGRHTIDKSNRQVEVKIVIYKMVVIIVSLFDSPEWERPRSERCRPDISCIWRLLAFERPITQQHWQMICWKYTRNLCQHSYGDVR